MNATNDQLLWYKDAIFYEVYIRAFADGNGDGQGDFSGLTEKLDYFRDLGIDCLWISPMYPSPLRDDGYDISDFTNIHPNYGNLGQFREFLAGAHQRGLKVIADLVLNHTSDQHPGSSQRSPARKVLSAIITSGPIRTSITRMHASSSSTLKNQTGPGTSSRAVLLAPLLCCQPDLNYDNPASSRRCCT